MSLGAWGLGAVIDPILALLEEHVSGAGQTGHEREVATIACTIEAIVILLPFLLADHITSIPSGADQQDPYTPAPPLPQCPTIIALQDVLGGAGQAEVALYTLHNHLGREWVAPWSQLDHFRDNILSQLVDTLAKLDTWPGAALDAFMALFTQLTHCLGPTITANTLAPLFTVTMDGADPKLVQDGATGLTGAVSVVYAVAILGLGHTGVDTELEVFLGRQISILGLCGAGLEAPLHTVNNLMADPRQSEAVLAALWGSVVHRSPAVRAAAAAVFWALLALVAGAGEECLGPRIVPALVTLASDSDVRVKAATLTPLATVLTTTTTKEVCIYLYVYVTYPITMDVRG